MYAPRFRRLITFLTLFVASVAYFSAPGSPQAAAYSSSPKSCAGGYWSDLQAWELLDAIAGGSDWNYCVIEGLFQARNSYLPVYAFETNVANDYGLVAVKPGGDCSPPGLPTGPNWDFELPCHAHDYCYDARKAGFSATVSDQGCDSEFWYLMEAHCNDRIFKQGCRDVRDIYYLAVSAPGVVTNSDPAPVALRPTHAPSKCAEIPNSSTGYLVPIRQYSCFYTANQKFYFQPAGPPGYFEIRPSHYPQHCATVTNGGTSLVQTGCTGQSTSIWSLWQQPGNMSLYSIRSQSSTGNKCWDVPYSSTANSVDLMEYWCNGTPNQIWNIG
jgi:hypothetical protein